MERLTMPTEPQERRPRPALIALINAIAREHRFIKKGGDPDHRQLAVKLGLSARGLDAAMEGRDPEALTLISLARWAHIPLIRVFMAAEWMAEGDVEDYLKWAIAQRTRESTRRAQMDLFAEFKRAADAEGLDQDDLELAAEVLAALQQVAERRKERSVRERGNTSAPGGGPSASGGVRTR